MRRAAVNGSICMATAAVAVTSIAVPRFVAATTTQVAAGSTCVLHGPAGPVSHVVWIQFDNVHLTRDNPNVPSDLEQMPHLLNFMEQNGTLLSNQHTPLIAHTADDLVTSMTGLYGARQGIPISNSYQYYQPNGTTATAGSFAYWRDPVVSYATASGIGTDHSPTMIGPNGMAPAPWVPFTRAGCNVGSVAMANTDLENVLPDVPLAYGRGSAAAAEAYGNPNLASTDFQGIAVHCAQGQQVCAATGHQVVEPLPNEPGGYDGYHAVFGTKYLDPVIAPSGCTGMPTICNLRGQPVTDGSGNPGFPGYNGMQAWNSLAYTAALQEHGVGVTYTYVSSAHESASTGNAFGPGQSAYVAQLAAYDNAFAKFFTQLASDGMTTANTLFLLGSDENDHFVGGPPSPSGCDGVHVACTYQHIGEVQGNLTGLVAQKTGVTTPFAVHADAAPAIYVNNQPGPSAGPVRALEHALGSVTALDPYAGGAVHLTKYLADPAELRLLHMWTADELRNPTLVQFANPDFYLSTGPTTCSPSSCVSVYPPEAWNHGDVASDINRTWVGLVGPGVARLGRNDSVWASHTDDNPTVLALLGLRGDYQPDGRALEELITPAARPGVLAGQRAVADYLGLGQVFTQLQSPVGALGLASLQVATHGIAGSDAAYQAADASLTSVGQHRDQLVSAMVAILDGAAFAGRAVNHTEAQQLATQGEQLIGCVSIEAGSPSHTC